MLRHKKETPKEVSRLDKIMQEIAELQKETRKELRSIAESLKDLQK